MGSSGKKAQFAINMRKIAARRKEAQYPAKPFPPSSHDQEIAVPQYASEAQSRFLHAVHPELAAQSGTGSPGPHRLPEHKSKRKSKRKARRKASRRGGEHSEARQRSAHD